MTGRQAVSTDLSNKNPSVGLGVQRGVQSDAPFGQLPTSGRDDGGRFTEGNVAALKHGLRSTRVQQALLPEQANVYAALAEKRQAIEAQLGGAEQLSPVMRDLVDSYLEVTVLKQWLGENLLLNGVLTTKGKRRAALTAFLAVVDRQERFARVLGLERRAKPVIDPLDYVKGTVDHP